MVKLAVYLLALPAKKQPLMRDLHENIALMTWSARSADFRVAGEAQARPVLSIRC